MSVRGIGFACIVLLAGAGSGSVEQRWLKLRSANFELFTTSGERRARDAILYFEQVRSFFEKATGAAPETGPPVRIIAFSSDKEYKPYQFSEVAAAYASSGLDRDYIVMKGIGSENYPVAVHEYTHLLLKPTSSSSKIPLWLDEGLAELYSTLKPVGKKVQIGDVIPWRYLALRTMKWLDLETLTAVDHDSPHYNEKTRATVFYAEAWALTHMLTLTEQYRPKFEQFLRAAASGDQKAAFEQVFGKKMWEVWTDLQTYMRKGQFNVGVYDLKLEKSAEQPEIREATPVESGVALASLLGAIHKWDESRAAFEGLARENPGDAEVEEGLGYAALRAGEREQARTHFGRAAELDSKNSRLYCDYANLLHQIGERSATMIPLYEKALELDPGLVKAHYGLGFSLLTEGKYDEAVKHLLQVKKVEREQAYGLFNALAYAYQRLGNQTEAIKAAELAKKWAQNPEQTAAAEKTLEYLKSPHRPLAVARSRPPEEDETPAPPPQKKAPPVAETAPAPKRPPPAGSTIEGTLEQVDCLGERARVRLRFAGKQLRFEILDPTTVVVTGVDGGKVDLGCGPQKPRRVAITFDPRDDGELGTIGIVKAMEFK